MEYKKLFIAPEIDISEFYDSILVGKYLKLKKIGREYTLDIYGIETYELPQNAKIEYHKITSVFVEYVYISCIRDGEIEHNIDDVGLFIYIKVAGIAKYFKIKLTGFPIPFYEAING